MTTLFYILLVLFADSVEFNFFAFWFAIIFDVINGHSKGEAEQIAYFRGRQERG